MGFPTAYKELPLPGYVLHALYILAFFRSIIATLFPYFGLPNFLAHEMSRPDPNRLNRRRGPIADTPSSSAVANFSGEILPVIRFSDLGRVVGEDESEENECAVCLTEIEGDDEIRRLGKCSHVFHRRCLDRWIVDYKRMTCPLCRTGLVDDDLVEDFYRRFFGTGSGVYGLYGEIPTVHRSYSGFNFL